MKQIIVFVVGCVILFSSSWLLAVTIQVPIDQPGIQAGIDAALDGDTVVVAPGTYVENINFLGKAITVQGQEGSGVTVIDGNQSGSVVTFASGEWEEAVIDGFAICAGRGTNFEVMPSFWYYCGGGIFCHQSSPTIMNCIIRDNNAEMGAGIFCHESSPLITGDIIQNNNVEYEGGGMDFYRSGGVIANSMIVENTVSYGIGGGISCSDSSPAIINCTISHNDAEQAGGGLFCGGPAGSSPPLINCILWENSADQGAELYVARGIPTINYSDIRGGLPGGEGNFNLDPLFVGAGDYHLTASSPCIDAGTDAGVYTDLDGETRPYGLGYDVGADETLCWDYDQDHYPDEACGGNDCDDADPEVYPGHVEIQHDQKDNDCDGLIDEKSCFVRAVI